MTFCKYYLGLSKENNFEVCIIQRLLQECSSNGKVKHSFCDYTRIIRALHKWKMIFWQVCLITTLLHLKQQRLVNQPIRTCVY